MKARESFLLAWCGSEVPLPAVKFRRGKELAQGDPESVAQLFDGSETGIFAFPVQDVFNRGLWDRRNTTQFIWRDFPFPT